MRTSLRVFKFEVCAPENATLRMHRFTSLRVQVYESAHLWVCKSLRLEVCLSASADLELCDFETSTDAGSMFAVYHRNAKQNDDTSWSFLFILNLPLHYDNRIHVKMGIRSLESSPFYYIRACEVLRPLICLLSYN